MMLKIFSDISINYLLERKITLVVERISGLVSLAVRRFFAPLDLSVQLQPKRFFALKGISSRLDFFNNTYVEETASSC